MSTNFVDPSTPSAPETAALTQPTPEQKREMAFDAQFSFRGQPLHPYTLSREVIVAELMGVRIKPTASASDAAFLPEAMAIIWICLHTPKDWRLFRQDAIAFWEVIEAWGDANVTPDIWEDVFLLVFGQKAAPEIPAEDDKPARPAVPYVMGIKESARVGMVVIKPDPAADPSETPGKPASPSIAPTT
jgi:hypothetical protein